MVEIKLITESEKLEYERKKKNLSMATMANMLGLRSKTSYYNIEKGLSEPKISQAIIIGKMLNKSPTYFFKIEVH